MKLLDLRLRHAAALTLLLAGCASSPSPSPADTQRHAAFNAALDRWNGAPLTELLKKLGKPTAATHHPDGSSVYVFTKSGTHNFSCTVRYTVDDKTQRVRSHQIEGC